MNLGGHESASISPLSTLKLKTKIIVRLHTEKQQWLILISCDIVSLILKPTAFLTHGCKTENHHSSLADGLNLRCVSLSSHREFPISHFLLLMLLAY